ncbi:MAG: recombinase family protein [Planctomycetaceae bacterium]|nr:recombinase family protein [Planctomycetaceae bacterium]
MTRETTSGKIRADHMRRLAVVYIRQSSAHQIRSNRESGQRQYALTERARSLGWPGRSVKTIDEDQGRSGTSSTHRQGFKKLLAEIGAGQVGIVLALEASRLARSSADWHRLVEICVVTQTLLADESAVYDPRDPNDRLLLGVKGTISEAELFTLRCRLQEGRWNKARRGELVRSLPAGYIRTETGEAVKHPDRQVQGRLNYIFRLFRQHKVARQVLVQLVGEKLKIPAKIWGGPRHGEIRWKEPDFSDLIRVLHNPTYAGAYVYGQAAYDTFDRSPTTGKARVHPRAVEDWSVCLRDAYPAYIGWDEFVENQRLLRSNWYRNGSRGAPRKGAALLQGIVFCGHCGARMSVLHYSTKEKRSPGYGCFQAYHRKGGATCQCMSAAGVDEAVTHLFLRAVTPARIEIALQAMEELQANRQETRRQWEFQLQQADYEIGLARRRYEAVDPSNRLVAAELEALWETALAERERLQQEQKVWEQRQDQPLSAQDRRLVQELSGDLERVWRAETTSMEERKTLLRFLVKRVHLDGVGESGRIRIDVEWHTGAHTSTTIDRPLVGVWAPRTPDAAVDRVHELLAELDYAAIAERLNEDGFRTAKGLAYNQQVVGYIVRSRGWTRSNGKPEAARRSKS